MTDQTKNRIALLVITLPAVSAGVFAAGAIAGLTFYVINCGFQTPEMFGWMGLFIVFGTMGLVTASVASIVAIAVEIIKNQSLLRSVGRMVVTGCVFGVLAVAGCFWINPKDTDVIAVFVSGAVCAAVSLVVAAVRTKHWSRTSQST